jgi:hypothetical protein
MTRRHFAILAARSSNEPGKVDENRIVFCVCAFAAATAQRQDTKRASSNADLVAQRH